MATKRAAEESPSTAGSSGPPAKKQLTRYETFQVGHVYSLEELDQKVLVFQNKKLAERIEQRRRAEDELRKRIEQLENRQRTDDAVLMIVNRYWNQLDEDIRVLLQRFDAETADEVESKNESDETTSFLLLLSTWDKQELEQRLGQRVEFSKRAVGKLLQMYDRLIQRNEKLHKALYEKQEKEKEELLEAAIKKEPKEPDDEPPSESIKEENGETDSTEDKKEERGEEPKKEVKEEPTEAPVSLEDIKSEVETLAGIVTEEVAELQKENKKLHNLVTSLHERHHKSCIQVQELQDQLNTSETDLAELKNKLDDLEYENEKCSQKVDRLDQHLSDAVQRLRNYKDTTEMVTVEGGKMIPGLSKNKAEEILSELEEQKEFANTRMSELERLNKDHQGVLKEVEKLKLDLQHIPEQVIADTTEYKILQSQFSVLYNESMQMRTGLVETKDLLQTGKNKHLRQIEQMESDELELQKKLRTEVIQLEDTLAQSRREYDMLRIEFEQLLAASEQTGPINREMRNLIQSLQNHNQQLKMDAQRYKRRLKESQNEVAKLKAGFPDIEVAEAKEETASTSSISSSSSLGTNPPNKPDIDLDPIAQVRQEEEEREEMDLRDKGKTDNDIIKDLRSQLKKSQDAQKELKLLLDMYKSVPKEQRDKVQLMAAEKKARQDIEEHKSIIKKMQENERKEKRKLAEEDAIKKIKKMEEQIEELTKNLASQKQREETLLNEMEVTGQAFEDMQEQNSRLLQQLREKDDANFKLMSERIKANQIQKLLREEKEIMESHVVTFQQQVESQFQVVRKLEEKERILQNNIATLEKELSLTQQAMEMHKRKAVESSQTAADLKLHLDKYQAQLKESQVAVGEKTASIEQEAFKYKRMAEEVAKLQRKLERHKKIEMAADADEVLMEENKEYKEQLTCPSCKVNKKDAVLTKCFHVFCLECLKTRYETRQRKCPKCNAGFGANDFHRLFLG